MKTCRDNSKAIRSSNASDLVMSITSWYSELANNEQSSKIYYQFFIDPEELKPEERFQCVLNLHALLLNFQNAYYFDNDMYEYTSEKVPKDSIPDKDYDYLDSIN